jgi:hypothetical protein
MASIRLFAESSVGALPESRDPDFDAADQLQLTNTPKLGS